MFSHRTAATAVKSIHEGLNKLRRNGLARFDCAKTILQGLKPTVILWYLRHDESHACYQTFENLQRNEFFRSL